MKYIGAHVSAAGGIQNAPQNAQTIGANCFALFTRNPRSWNSPELRDEAVAAFKVNIAAVHIQPHHILPHDSYLINIGSPKDEIRQKSITALSDELRRASMIGARGVNFHPGAHLKMISVERCIELIAEAANDILKNNSGAALILENTAGQGSTIGRTFDELAQIIERIELKERTGVCLDTCHLFASGYDIRTKTGWDETMRAFDETVGHEYLCGMHLNDSIGTMGSHIDRHQSLGGGELGWEVFEYIMQDARTDNMPLILETNNPEIWAEEIAHLRSFL